MFLISLISIANVVVLQVKPHYYYYLVIFFLFFEASDQDDVSDIPFKWYTILNSIYIIFGVFLAYFSHSLPVSWFDNAQISGRVSGFDSETVLYNEGIYGMLLRIFGSLAVIFWLLIIVVYFRRKNISVYLLRVLDSILFLSAAFWTVIKFSYELKKQSVAEK